MFRNFNGRFDVYFWDFSMLGFFGWAGFLLGVSRISWPAFFSKPRKSSKSMTIRYKRAQQKVPPRPTIIHDCSQSNRKPNKIQIQTHIPNSCSSDAKTNFFIFKIVQFFSNFLIPKWTSFFLQNGICEKDEEIFIFISCVCLWVVSDSLR